MTKPHFIAWFKDINKHDIPVVGGKGANLGEMTQAKFPVPNGFVVTSTAYFHFIKENNLTTKIKHLINTINFDRAESIQQVSVHIKKIIMEGKISEALVDEIVEAYKVLGGPMMDGLVAVRSSATAEDLPDASFAGQQETFLNVRGEANVVLKVKAAWASLFEARAIFYRNEQKYNHFKVGLAAVVQKMVNSETSGVMFTIDPVTNDKTKIVIESVYGLGEMIVQGIVTPDHYELAKDDLTISKKVIGPQEKMMVKNKTSNEIIKVEKSKQNHQKISDKHIKEIAELGKKLEKHYYFPQDVEWAIEKDDVYIVQTRPITTVNNNKETSLDVTTELSKLEVILKGSPASPGVASGPINTITSLKDVGNIKEGEVLLAPQTNPDYVPAMKKAVAIITEMGGRTSHAAIVSRELGIPAVVGAEGAMKKLRLGDIVTVDGREGIIYKGTFAGANQQKDNVVENIKTATKIYVNLAQPDLAEKVSKMGADGIGLLRAEFMMANIGVHPKKMIRDGKKHEYVKKLTEQLSMFCKAFDGRPVVYRTSDFKTNEYRGLTGGKEFEPVEENPMIGYRGAFRYVHDPEVFDLELEAIKNVRNKLGHKNLWVMIPFVRTVQQLIAVKRMLAHAGLHRTASFKLWMMVEVPSNFILLQDFINVGIDGISIGSNDLTMLILGTDRDSSEVSSVYNEQDPAVLWALERIVTTARKNNITVSICGQAPSQYPELVEKLVSWGATSVSVSPDAINTTRKIVAAAEKKILNK